MRPHWFDGDQNSRRRAGASRILLIVALLGMVAWFGGWWLTEKPLPAWLWAVQVVTFVSLTMALVQAWRAHGTVESTTGSRQRD